MFVYFLNGKSVNEKCHELHQKFNQFPKLSFPLSLEQIPDNGIYILFEKGEHAHDTNRIVRVGTHTGEKQLKPRIKQHFVKEKKDRSIFRKNIGRCILNKSNDPFLEHWDLDLTTRKAREKHASEIDFDKQANIEKQVSEYLRSRFSIAVFEVPEKEDRLHIESRITSTVSLCDDCKPSTSWLGLDSTKQKIRESGLWQVNELYKTPFDSEELKKLSENL